ncbi:MAG TPA: DUF4173 domain-containing protein [Candidatus Limnocylindrales bacterium]|nr:DUF4173 domain-containing protein [Candidatus Limnocylindrales bacterium]
MTRPVAIRILVLAAVIGLVAQALLLGNLLGVNAPILAVALLGAAFVLRPGGRRIDPLDRWLPAAAVAISLSIAIRADPDLLAIDLAAALALLGASIAAIAGEAVTRRSAVRVVELGFTVIGWAGVGILRVSAATRRPDPGPDGERVLDRLPSWAGPVARGILIAIPLLFVFGSLFSAADVAFERLIGRLFTWNLDLGELPIRLSIAFLIAWGVAGLLAVAAGALDRAADAVEPPPGEPLPQSLGAAALGLPDATRSDGPWPLPRLGAIESATILIAVDVLFGVFVILQVAYLFGGLDTLAATGLPYAQYARSGFFELIWVALLAGGLLATVHAIAARRTPALVGAGLALAGLTAVVLASALLRLRIYQDAYGWTELRFYVLATIVWLAIGIGITITLLYRDRMRWLLHGLAIAAVVVLAGINIVGPSRLIAEQNVARVVDPFLVPADGKSGLDVTYAVRLGDDAIPALVAALPALDPADREELFRRLLLRRVTLDEASATGWPSWNLGRELAREALATLPPR